jgi:hypothetical protein
LAGSAVRNADRAGVVLSRYACTTRHPAADALIFVALSDENLRPWR